MFRLSVLATRESRLAPGTTDQPGRVPTVKALRIPRWREGRRSSPWHPRSPNHPGRPSYTGDRRSLRSSRLMQGGSRPRRHRFHLSPGCRRPDRTGRRRHCPVLGPRDRHGCSYPRNRVHLNPRPHRRLASQRAGKRPSNRRSAGRMTAPLREDSPHHCRCGRESPLRLRPT